MQSQDPYPRVRRRCGTLENQRRWFRWPE